MLRYDDEALEDTSGIEPDRVESEINPNLAGLEGQECFKAEQSEA